MSSTWQKARAGLFGTLLALAIFAILPVSPASAGRVAAAGEQFPAVAEALSPRVKVFAAPGDDARRIAVMSAFRYDYRPTVFFVIGRHQNAIDDNWFRVEVPGRPNGRRGWVRSSQLRVLRNVGSLRIEIDRSQRRLRLQRGSRTVFSSPVAVGAPGAPTPLGSFYVTARFSPSDSFLGPWAFETSAYAAITDWPRGGIVGLHGTSEPASVGRRESHGCLRMFNRAILHLRKMVRLGTPIRIRQ